MNKRKITLQLTELDEVDVSHVSLVGHGAMRTPFKIIKTAKENSMFKKLDLSALFGIQKQEPEVEAPVVAGVVVKTEDADGMAKTLEEQGHTIVGKQENDGVTILCLKEDIDEDAFGLQVNDQAALLLENVEKSFYSFPEGSTFSENMSQAGFYPGLHVATDVMLSTVYNIMDGDGENPVDAVKSALTEFTKYVTSLVATVPATAFKMDDLRPLAQEIAEATIEDNTGTDADGNPIEPTEKTEGTEQEEAAEPTEKTEETDGDTTDTSEAVPTEKAEGEEVSAEATDPESQADTDDVTTVVKTMLEDFRTSLSGQLDELKAQVEGVVKTTDELSQRVEKSEDVLGMTVDLTTTTDPNSPTPTEKAEKSVYDDVLKFDGFEFNQ